MEAEFVACYEAITQALWLRNFIISLMIIDSISRHLKIFCDNSAVVFFSKNNRSGIRNKHNEIKYLKVRENVKKQKLSIKHISTKLMIADPITKSLLTKPYKDHMEHMGLNSLLVV